MHPIGKKIRVQELVARQDVNMPRMLWTISGYLTSAFDCGEYEYAETMSHDCLATHPRPRARMIELKVGVKSLN